MPNNGIFTIGVKQEQICHYRNKVYNLDVKNESDFAIHAVQELVLTIRLRQMRVIAPD
ncbi:hypothetical protein N9X12_05085 [Alphaproteobacteria bacterium]|nr:hypothetical protein [Alphaproteobacteria bacterium]